MSLISVSFFIFICILLIIYYKVDPGNQWKVLLIGSLVFYAWVRPVYIVFILISIISTFYLIDVNASLMILS